MAKDKHEPETTPDAPAPSAELAALSAQVAELTAKLEKLTAPKTSEETRLALEADEARRRAAMAEAKERARERAKQAAGTYRVSYQDMTGVFEARDANDAWAQFCDKFKTWPSPKYSVRSIERVVEPKAEESAKSAA